MRCLMWELSGGKEMVYLVITSPREKGQKWKTVQLIHYNFFINTAIVNIIKYYIILSIR